MVTFAELPGKDYFFKTKQYFAVELRITTTQLGNLPRPVPAE